MRMRHIVVCGLSGSTIFFHFLINGTILEKKVAEHKMCIVIFSTPFLSETSFMPRRNERDTIKNVYWFSCEVPLIPVRF